MIINPLPVFEQFGFVKEKETDKDFIGICPFCKSKGHFGINKTDPAKKWHCFKCGKGGGYATFIKTVISEARENKTQIAELAYERGLSIKTLEAMEVGWLNGVGIIPVYSKDKKTILSIKIFKGKKLWNLIGGQQCAYGLWVMPDEYETIYLTEGEWDTLAMLEICNDKRATIFGTPGAGIKIKPEHYNLFIGKSVYLLFDNDKAGERGNTGAVRTLTPLASEIREFHWTETTGNKWDVRDVYAKDFKGDKVKTLEWIHAHSKLITLEKNIETPEIKGEYVPYTLVYDTFGKWFHLSDNEKYDQKATDIYDIIFGMVFANRIPGDPVWLYLNAPPGGFKTEPLLALSGGKLIEIHESVTAPALISGQNQGAVDPSLIPQLNGRLLIIKDWTIILGLPEHERKEILSILRGAFDGVCGRTFGNGIRRNIKSTFGIIAATTPVIEQYTEEMAAVGERFLTWRNWISEDFEVRHGHIKKALDNTAKEQEMRKEISAVSKRVLLSGNGSVPTCDDDLKNTIIKMSQWISVMRGSVCRDKYRKNVLYKPFSEVGTRLAKEILKLLLGISIFKGHKSVRPDTMRIAKSIAWSSVSTRYAETLKAFLFLKEKSLTAAEAEKVVGLPQETMTMVMENMMMLGILEKSKDLKWNIKPNFLTLTKGAKLL